MGTKRELEREKYDSAVADGSAEMGLKKKTKGARKKRLVLYWKQETQKLKSEGAGQGKAGESALL